MSENLIYPVQVRFSYTARFALEEIAGKRKQTVSDVIRDLVDREIEIEQANQQTLPAKSTGRSHRPSKAGH